jgi:polysaccharide pyruvyl transferase CsaB
MEAARPRRIAISGSYGGYNLGDEAILQAIIAELRGSGPVELTVFCRDPADTQARHGVAAHRLGALPRREAQVLIGGLDLFILGGGGLLYDEDADMYLRELGIAHEVGTPVMLYAIGAGPLFDVARRARVRGALEPAAVITVRDHLTRELLEEIGVEHEIEVTADPAFLLEPTPLTLDEILHAEAIDPEARLIGFSVREPGPAAPGLDIEHYHRLIANAADYVIDRLDAEVVFLPFERRTYDVQHSHAVVGRMTHAQRATVLKREYTPGQLLSLLGHFEMTVGMRLHALVFSALADVPFVGLPYARKVQGLIEALDLPVPAFSDLGQVSAGQLIALVDRVWDQREQLRAHLRSRVPELVRRARLNHAHVLELLSRAPIPSGAAARHPEPGAR